MLIMDCCWYSLLQIKDLEEMIPIYIFYSMFELFLKGWGFGLGPPEIPKQEAFLIGLTAGRTHFSWRRTYSIPKMVIVIYLHQIFLTVLVMILRLKIYEMAVILGGWTKRMHEKKKNIFY